jgi:hypothetical protein
MQTWTSDTSAVIGVLMGVGIGVPLLYDEWSIRSTRGSACLWVAITSMIVSALYAFVFVLATRLGANTDVSVLLALGLTTSLGIVFSLYRS